MSEDTTNDLADDTPQVDEQRLQTVQLLTKAVQKLGWDVRFQESAHDLAVKLTDAVEHLSEEEATENDVQAPTV